VTRNPGFICDVPCFVLYFTNYLVISYAIVLQIVWNQQFRRTILFGMTVLCLNHANLLKIIHTLVDVIWTRSVDVIDSTQTVNVFK